MSLAARSRLPASQASTAPLPLVVSGAVAGAAAALLSYLALAVVALAAWMLDPGGDQEWSQMLEVASGAWLAGLGLPPTVDGITITLLPLGFALVPIVALVGAGRWAADASAVARRGEAVAVAASAAVAFAAVAAAVAALAGTLLVPASRAALMGGIVAFVVCSLVVLSRARLLTPHRWPSPVRDAMGAVAVALAGLAVVASALLAVSVIAHVGQMNDLLVGLDAGASGSLLLAVLTLAYLPNALLWSASYALGPGVSVSAGVSLSPFAEVSSASLPGFPLLAALPAQAPPGAMLLPLTGVAAGVLAGALLRRRGHAGFRGSALAALVGLSTGVVVALLAWLAGGSLGTGSLQGLGPAPLASGLACAVLVAVGALGVASWPSRTTDV